MDLEELQQIIRLLKEEGLTEITVSNGDKRITVRREGDNRLLPRAAESEPGTEEQDKDANVITAPLLGTFYSRPSPEDDPFVSEGDQISPGDTLCIIDAMKVMNEIKAEFAAKIVKALVEDGDPVQYGQPLFRFERI
ncbi:MAG TPA: acetyl-CoA carboxylase biotin carboxyl carrier protein [Candidatus Acetothermia bacterium]|nr:acetyl-CoA carboxylase biotin carboxyl carrier protein [Candidatus Acetothermia bacterium]